MVAQLVTPARPRRDEHELALGLRREEDLDDAPDGEEDRVDRRHVDVAE